MQIIKVLKEEGYVLHEDFDVVVRLADTTTRYNWEPKTKAAGDDVFVVYETLCMRSRQKAGAEEAGALIRAAMLHQKVIAEGERHHTLSLMEGHRGAGHDVRLGKRAAVIIASATKSMAGGRPLLVPMNHSLGRVHDNLVLFYMAKEAMDARTSGAGGVLLVLQDADAAFEATSQGITFIPDLLGMGEIFLVGGRRDKVDSLRRRDIAGTEKIHWIPADNVMSTVHLGWGDAVILCGQADAASVKQVRHLALISAEPYPGDKPLALSASFTHRAFGNSNDIETEWLRTHAEMKVAYLPIHGVSVVRQSAAGALPASTPASPSTPDPASTLVWDSDPASTLVWDSDPASTPDHVVETPDPQQRDAGEVVKRARTAEPLDASAEPVPLEVVERYG